MRSKSKKVSKTRKKNTSPRRGEVVALYLKRATMVLLAGTVIASAVLAVKWIGGKFYLREVLVTGAYHLDAKEIVSSSKIEKGDSLLEMDLGNIQGRLAENSWIKGVSLRKQFPGTLLMDIEEATPKALLSINKRLYIIDGNGKRLEKIKGESTPFLPVIKNINSKNKKAYAEALKLVNAMSEKNLFAGRESVEIGHESYGLTMRVEGELIKVGYGDYEKKFERWEELEPEIRRRGLELKYVDLRFKDSVIVKPAKPAKKEKTS